MPHTRGMGTRGKRALYKGAAWRYLQSELGATATPEVAARLMGLPESVTGRGYVPSQAEFHLLRMSLEHFDRSYPVSTRVFVGYAE